MEGNVDNMWEATEAAVVVPYISEGKQAITTLRPLISPSA